MSLTSLNVKVEWDGINNVKELCLRRLLDFAFTTLSEDVLSLLRIFDFPNLEEIQVVKLPGFFFRRYSRANGATLQFPADSCLGYMDIDRPYQHW